MASSESPSKHVEDELKDMRHQLSRLQAQVTGSPLESEPEVRRLEAINSALESEVTALKHTYQTHINELLIGIGRVESDFQSQLETLRTAVATLPERDKMHGQHGDKENGGANARKRFFTVRASKLTDMLRVPDYATIHNLFVTIVIMAGLNIFITDYFESGALMDLSLIWWCFGDFGWAAVVWALMLAFCYAIIPVAWVVHHRRGPVRSLFVGIYVAMQVTMYAVPAYFARRWDLPPATAMALLVEQTRLSLKLHSYLRESYPAGLDDYLHSTVRPDVLLESTVPRGGTVAEPWRAWTMQSEVAAYTYFLFVPTLLYRRAYPVGYGVRYAVVLRSFAEVVATVYFTYIVFRFVGPQFEKKAHEALTLRTIVLSVFSSMMPAMLVYVMSFFALLHSWMNAWAEMLRFGDRHFYDDWWNAASWADFYRRWNGVVHDWIAAYLYRDSMVYLGLSRRTAQLFAFAVSAIIHEWVIFAALGFVYPVLLVLFAGPGIVFISLTEKREGQLWNIFMWLMLAVGNGLLMVLYSREWYARRSPHACVSDGFTWISLMPRSWFIGGNCPL